MGLDRADLAVADAGPLIHLNEIARLSLLAVFNRVHLTDAVWAETVLAGRVAPDALRPLSVECTHLDDGEVAEFVKQTGLQHLHRGECESLCLCRRLGARLVLTDDLAGRDAAKRMSIRPVGSLGVVLRASRLGMISLEEAEWCLMELHRTSTLFVTGAIVESAIALLRDTSGQREDTT